MSLWTSHQLPLVYIKWEDSARSEGWRDSTNKTICICETVGLCLHQDKNLVTVTSSVSDDGFFICQLTIPRKSIVEMRELNVPAKRPAKT